MIEWENLGPGDHRHSCPQCGRSDRDNTLGVTVEDQTGVAHCFRCQYVETWRDTGRSAVCRTQAAGPAAARRAKFETLSDFGRELWGSCVSLNETQGESYLRARCCAVPPDDGDLRYHPALKHPSGHVGPALVGLVTHAATRAPLTLHRTWIKADGAKADVEPPRMLLGGHRKQGGVIRLWPDEAVTYGLGIAEGIETALTLATVLRPVWSLIDAGNLAALPVLPGIQVLTIAADNDPAGVKAANECATRWSLADVDVRLVIPPGERMDLNDVAREGAHG